MTIISISFWSTQYFIDVLHAPASAVRAGFIFCALTAPVGGVLFGGAMVDRAGGYSGLHQRTEALQRCVGFLAVGAAAALATCLFGGARGGDDDHFDPWTVLLNGVLLWLVLFFGSAALPPSMGVLLNSVHPDMRPFAASVATIAYNILGYTLGPLLSGQMMTVTHSFEQGFRVILYAAFPCLFLMLLAWNESRAQRKARRRELQRRAEHDAALAAHRHAAQTIAAHVDRQA
jgi:MFS family permease